MRVQLLVATTCFLVQSLGFSQDHLQCGHTQRTKELLNSDPTLKQKYDLAQQKLNAAADSAWAVDKDGMGVRGTIYTIPVVFHVLHNDGEEKISIAQCKRAIEILNQDYRASNPDLNLVVDNFQGMQGDAEIEFKLATKAPDGKHFPGVTYTRSHYTHQKEAGITGDDQAKMIIAKNDVYNYASGWLNYMNIYVCKEIGGDAGYTYLPFINSVYKQIWILSTHVGDIGTGTTHNARTLTHEVGHWLNLKHPWGSGNEAGHADNCSKDDNVKDTPLCKGIKSCALSYNSCDGDNAYWGFDQIDNVENFMAYSRCNKMFTKGQASRMRAALTSSISDRNKLWTEANLIKTGVKEDPVLYIADFTSDFDKVCRGAKIKFTDASYNNASTWKWSFPGGTPSTSTKQNPEVIYSSNGSFGVTLTVTDASGNTLKKNKPNYITVSSQPGVSLPYKESFENVSSLASNQWETKTTDNRDWEISNAAGATGNSSVILYRKGNSNGQIDRLISPAINLQGSSNMVLSFKYAFKRKKNKGGDKMRVRFSNDCGVTWSTKKTLSGSLQTATSSILNFVPDADEWKTVTVPIGNSFLIDKFQFQFEYTYKYGNNLYIDDINVHNSTSIPDSKFADHVDLSIAPNPFANKTVMKFNLPSASMVSVQLTDLLGREITSIAQKLYVVGKNEIEILSNHASPGTYLVKLQIEEKVIVKPVIIK